MRLTKKNILYILVGITLISLFGNNTSIISAAGPPGDEIAYADMIDCLQITNGTYLDLDLDGYEDDIITEFTVYSPTGLNATIRLDYEFYLTLPSGKTFYMTYKTVETFIDLPTDVHWYNTAEEAGDYTFTLKAWIRGTDIAGNKFNIRVIESLIFDPPEYKDSGRPFGMIIY